ncbi:hypothetical protein BGZ94_008797 [Podila epigama]|nr:hypothetical protein BGZ94_008797 [Podila epigama]
MHHSKLLLTLATVALSASAHFSDSNLANSNNILSQPVLAARGLDRRLDVDVDLLKNDKVIDVKLHRRLDNDKVIDVKLSRRLDVDVDLLKNDKVIDVKLSRRHFEMSSNMEGSSMTIPQNVEERETTLKRKRDVESSRLAPRRHDDDDDDDDYNGDEGRNLNEVESDEKIETQDKKDNKESKDHKDGTTVDKKGAESKKHSGAAGLASSAVMTLMTAAAASLIMWA